MRKAKKTLTMVLAFVLVIALSVFGTMAYLTSTSNPVTNSFTVGKVKVTLDESKVNVYGELDRAVNRVTENQYKLIPGHEYIKDPTIHVQEESEPCWLAAKIENGLGTDATITMAEGWTQIGTSNVWVYGTAVDARTEQKDVQIFTKFTFGLDADPTAYSAAQIVVTAYAIQQDGFANATAAYNATFGATP
jgi:predicted ribosomally synthesized peptide with SipW-like signal peptide